MSILLFHEAEVFYYSFKDNELQSKIINKNSFEFIDNNDQQHYLLIDSPRFTLIPNSIFTASHSKQLFLLNFGELSYDERVYFTLNSAFDIANIYSIKKEIDEFRSSLNQNLTIDHLSNGILKFLKIHSLANQFLLVITPNYIYLGIKNGQKLIQLSAIDYENEEDILYYVIAQINSLNIIEIDSLSVTKLEGVHKISLEKFKALSKSIKLFSEITFSELDTKKFLSVI